MNESAYVRKKQLAVFRRSCPHCRSSMSWIRITLRALFVKEWTCHHCDARLRFDNERRDWVSWVVILVSVTFIIWSIGRLTIPGQLIPPFLLCIFSVFLERVAVVEICDSRCTSCGYSLRGLMENRCPECGAPFEMSSKSEAVSSKAESSQQDATP